jgi:hypothetical protein
MLTKGDTLNELPILFLRQFEALNIFDWNSTFAINPLPIDEMVIPHTDNLGNTSDVTVCNEPEPSWLVRSLIFYNDTVI